METLEYSQTHAPSSRMATAYALVSVLVGLGANVWGARMAWAVHALPQGSTFHSRGLETLLFVQAMTAAALGVGFGLAALVKGRGKVGVVLIACLGLHVSLTPYLVSNLVLDHVATAHRIDLDP